MSNLLNKLLDFALTGWKYYSVLLAVTGLEQTSPGMPDILPHSPSDANFSDEVERAIDAQRIWPNSAGLARSKN